MIRWLEKVYATWFALVFVGTFLLLYPAFLFLLSDPKYYSQANSLRRFWARWILLFTAVSIRIEYENPRRALPPKAVYVSNHTSYLDILSMALVVPGNFMFLAKAELAKIPLFGIFFRTVDMAIARQNPAAAAQSYKQSLRRVGEGVSAIVFPEATIGKQVPNLKPFKQGAFKLALDAELPVVPVSLLSNFILLPDGKGFRARPGTMRIFVHETIDPKLLSLQNNNSLSQHIFKIIQNKLIAQNIITKHEEYK